MVHSHKLSVSHVTLSNALTLTLLPQCCYVLCCTTYSFCLHSWYKYSIGLPHPAVPKHLLPLCFSSLFPEYHVLIDNSGGSDIWAWSWYVLCRSPPFLPLLSKKKVGDASCVLLFTLSYQHKTAGSVSLSGLKSRCDIWVCVTVWTMPFVKHDIQNAAYMFEVCGTSFYVVSKRDVLASVHILVSSGGHTQSKNICIKSIQRMIFSNAIQYFCLMWCITHHKPPCPCKLHLTCKELFKLLDGFDETLLTVWLITCLWKKIILTLQNWIWNFGEL